MGTRIDELDTVFVHNQGTVSDWSEGAGWGTIEDADAEQLAAALANPDTQQDALRRLRDLIRNESRHGLQWASRKLNRSLGKERSLEALETGLPYLTRRADLDVEGADPNMERPHILIEGDNLHALTALRGTHTDKVDIIYIDPPYNTGKEFTYNDNFIDPEHPYRHSAWLDFMWRRLKVARELLAETGVVMISIDDNEQANLKLLCDEVFGESNFVGQVIWDGGAVKNNSRLISVTHEYVLVYVKNRSVLIENDIVWRKQRDGYSEVLAEYERLREVHGSDNEAIQSAITAWLKAGPFTKRMKVYNRVDDRGLFTPADLSAPGGGGGTFDVLHPVTQKPCKSPSRGWGYKKETIERLVEEDRIIFGSDEQQQPLRKLYLADAADEVFRSVVSHAARASTHDLEYMVGRGKFDYPKNIDMLSDLIRLSSGSNAIVLDFFAGSGTTGHAVAALNAEDGGTRQCIMVTLDENGICQDVTRKRMEAVLTGVWADGKEHEALPGSLVFYQANEMAELPESTGSTVDWDMDLDAVAASSLYESVFLKESAWTPLVTDSPTLSAAAKANGDVVAVWRSSFVAGDILEALAGLEASTGAVRTVFAAEPVVNSAGGEKAFESIGWTVESYPADLASGVNRARKTAIADH